jgi:hypothetical protein
MKFEGIIICFVIYLNNDQEADAEANVTRIAVHASHDVDNGLTDGDDHSEYYLRDG